MTAKPENITPTKQWKLDAIDLAFEERGVRTFADLGAIGVVYGQYSMHAIDLPGVERGVMVDDYEAGLSHPWVVEQTGQRGLEVVLGNFADETVAESIGNVDAVFLFEVLLHAANPDWTDLIDLWAPRTGCFVVANPQWNGPRSERLIDLGRERYLEVVPNTHNHRALFERLDDPVEHLGKKWRDAHHVWQWGITDDDLTRKMHDHGFRLLDMSDHGPFLGHSADFTNKSFVFAVER